jgi:hypothetical protein
VVQVVAVLAVAVELHRLQVAAAVQVVQVVE